MTRFILVVFGNIVYSGRDLPSPFCSIYYTAPIVISEHELDSSGFKYLLFSPRKFGEDFHFDEHIFQMGWFGITN